MSEMNVTRRNFLSGAALVSAAHRGGRTRRLRAAIGRAGRLFEQRGRDAWRHGRSPIPPVGFDGTGTLPGSARRPQSATIRWKKS